MCLELLHKVDATSQTEEVVQPPEEIDPIFQEAMMVSSIKNLIKYLQRGKRWPNFSVGGSFFSFLYFKKNLPKKQQKRDKLLVLMHISASKLCFDIPD